MEKSFSVGSHQLRVVLKGNILFTYIGDGLNSWQRVTSIIQIAKIIKSQLKTMGFYCNTCNTDTANNQNELFKEGCY